jgi:hypothetical protein
VLIEILDALFGELETHLTGWFGRKRRSRDLIKNIRGQLSQLKDADEVVDTAVKTVSSIDGSRDLHAKVGTPSGTTIAASGAVGISSKQHNET